MGSEQVTVTIDDAQISVSSDSSILDAAHELGIWIPTLCHYQGLTPYSVCRVCTVEVTEGTRVRLVTACSTTVRDGAVVRTDTERVRTARRIIVELLCARHGTVGARWEGSGRPQGGGYFAGRYYRRRSTRLGGAGPA